MRDVWKYEAGEKVRPLSCDEVKDVVETFLNEWIDAHEGLDSGHQDVQDAIYNVIENLDDGLESLLVCANSTVQF